MKISWKGWSSALVFLIVLSCQEAPGPESLDPGLADPAAWARDFGWKGQLRAVPADQAPWLVQALDPKTFRPLPYRLVAGEAEAHRVEAEYQRQGHPVAALPVDNAAVWGDQASILPTTNATALEKAHWVMAQVAGTWTQRFTNREFRVALHRFLTGYAVERWAAQREPATSLALQAYRHRNADEATFWQLTSDLTQQAQRLGEGSLSDEERNARLAFLAGQWQKDFNAHYATRFLTSEFREAGRAPLTADRLAAWAHQTALLTPLRSKLLSLPGPAEVLAEIRTWPADTAQFPAKE